jgi:N-acetylglutamate synthase-like GNAT family acetyltransferase
MASLLLVFTWACSSNATLPGAERHRDFGVPVTIQFATRRDKKKLQEICVAAGMDLAGRIEEHLVIRQDSVLIGGAMLAQSDHDLFHLLLIAVDASCRSNGAASQLLQKMLRDPWNCCRDAVDGSGKGYRITTVARGAAAGFYRKHGFEQCDFAELADPYRDQCGACPERQDCHPVAMRFSAP